MASSTLIPIGEYLGRRFRPDCDYVDGELYERNLEEQDHSDLQSQLIELLRTRANKKFIRANTEIRVQVREDRFRVPDVCVQTRNAPSEQIVKQPPLLCIEVLSADDTVTKTRVRVRDFLERGGLQVGSSIQRHAASRSARG